MKVILKMYYKEDGWNDSAVNVVSEVHELTGRTELKSNKQFKENNIILQSEVYREVDGSLVFSYNHTGWRCQGGEHITLAFSISQS